MSALGTSSLTGSNLAALISSNTPSSSSSNPPSSGDAGAATSGSRGPATNVDLSDHVKAILARAATDETAAERLRSFVKANGKGGNGSSPAEVGSKQADPKTEIGQAFQRLTGGDVQSADTSQDLGPVEPTINFSDHVQIGGFSISVTADAQTGAFSTVINGPDGLSFFDKRFGQNGEVSGSEGVQPGVTVGSYQAGNVEYVTFTQNQAAAASATASSGSESIAASAAATDLSSVTFAIDFTTGSIRAALVDAATASATAQANQKFSPLSIVA